MYVTWEVGFTQMHQYKIIFKKQIHPSYSTIGITDL